MKYLNFKINFGKRNGETIKILCDDEGIPVDRYWFRRYIDSKIDNCIRCVDKDNKSKKELKKGDM